ncbi:NAD(P)-dependent oxidoreductase [Streptomyces fradiae]|uniref:NAD(P)-dependent oxidoreductase n=1 Tax=Streptomyces fradiae TaxID=1906 RepID=UPI000A3B5AA7|nr:NAD(P)-dependent oxidoreductase [Streptomyces fradiae]
MVENAEQPAYPVGLRLAGRRVVVIGGGQVAQRRLPALIAAGADITLVSPSATPSVEAMAEAGEIRWERRRYEEGDLADTWYALVATTDREANARASAEAERTRTWCVRADDAEAATAWTPATGRIEGVTVAVLTGTDPRRSAAVRDAIVEGLRDGTLAAPQHRARAPFVALVGGGPGDPDLITVRGRRLLAEADVVIFPPSNPVVSIGTILAVPGIREAIAEAGVPVVGLSPIVGDAPVRGMADKVLAAVGVEATASAVARHYGSGLLDGWLVDTVDADAVAEVEAAGIRCRAVPLMMTDVDAAAAMAREALALAEEVRG